MDSGRRVECLGADDLPIHCVVLDGALYMNRQNELLYLSVNVERDANLRGARMIVMVINTSLIPGSLAKSLLNHKFIPLEHLTPRDILVSNLVTQVF